MLRNLATDGIAQAEIEAYLGPWVLSTIFSCLFTGVIITQSYTYFSTFQKDLPLLRWTVIISMILNCVSFGLDGAAIWQQTIPAERDENLFKPLKPAVINMGVIAAVAAISQMFYAIRAYKVTKKRIIPFVCGMQILVTGVFGMALPGIKMVVNNRTFLNCLFAWLWATCATDLTLSGILMFNLRSLRVGFNRNTDFLLGWIIKCAVSTAGVISLVAITDAILALLIESNFHLPFTHFLPRIYTCSVLYVLNSRATLRQTHNLTNSEPIVVDVLPEISLPPRGSRAVVKSHRYRHDELSSLELNDVNELVPNTSRSFQFELSPIPSPPVSAKRTWQTV